MCSFSLIYQITQKYGHFEPLHKFVWRFLRLRGPIILLFKKIWPKKSNFEEISKLFLGVSIASIMMKFAQKMHIGIIKLSMEVEFWVFWFFSKYSLLTQKKHKKYRKITKNGKKRLKIKNSKFHFHRKFCCAKTHILAKFHHSRSNRDLQKKFLVVFKIFG